ncbi:ECF transporter S component [Lysinibacillus sp. 54212]|uniref:ECF transporter S component n=1 Tax=Lysinibacillus sp. 54212 TaxID=3119829 RepID=UPI002FCAD947
MEKKKLTIYVLTGLIAALCAIGNFIKIPGPITTAALDSAPALLSVAFLPPLFSGLTAAIGHIATGLTAGMPLGPFHAVIALEMFFILYIFNILHRKGFSVLKWTFVIVANGIIAPMPFYFLVSPAFYFASVPSLTVATIINVIVAIIVLPVLQKVIARKGALKSI